MVKRGGGAGQQNGTLTFLTHGTLTFGTHGTLTFATHGGAGMLFLSPVLGLRKGSGRSRVEGKSRVEGTS